jgi:hypothetical protein
MKKLFSKTAFSLLELIITSVLVVFVILGIFAVNGVLSSNNQDYGQRYFVKSETQTTLNHILNNASMAIGSGTKDSYGNLDLGIQIGSGGVNDPGVGDANSFCIHQDISSLIPDYTTANKTPTSPPSYNTPSNSRWLCYTWYPSGSNAYQIWYCAYTFSPAISYPSTRGAASCNVNSAFYLGTAFTNPFSTTSASFSPTTGVFSVTLQNCLNNSALYNSALSCNGAGANPGTSSDPVNNPEVQLSGSVTPSQVGLQQS